MEYILRKINHGETQNAAALLTASFLEDQGVMVLFKKKQSSYHTKVHNWFSATLALMLNNGQYIMGAYQANNLVGIMLVSHTTFKPLFTSLFKWTVSVAFNCGLGTVIKSAQHDQARSKLYTQQHQLILEFIAVDDDYRGKGIGRMLFNELHQYASTKGSTVWLETTKEVNVKIFEKMHYRLLDTITERSIKYHIMTNEH